MTEFSDETKLALELARKSYAKEVIEKAAKDMVKEPVELIERILYVQMKSILEEVYDQMHKPRQAKLDKIQEWYETADRSAESWSKLNEIMENQNG